MPSTKVLTRPLGVRTLGNPKQSPLINKTCKVYIVQILILALPHVRWSWPCPSKDLQRWLSSGARRPWWREQPCTIKVIAMILHIQRLRYEKTNPPTPNNNRVVGYMWPRGSYETWLYSKNGKSPECYLVITTVHDDVIKWKHFPRYWPFVRGIHWSPVNSPHKGQRRRHFFDLRLNEQS